MNTYHPDTICAISTPSGVGGISVIRISGPDALSLATLVFKPKNSNKSLEHQAHHLRYGTLLDPHTGSRVDEALVAFMRTPRSYTGEDVVEINCHGGPVVMESMLKILFRAGARPADPGEFTKRAFLNGRIDLVQAESVLDVILARSELSLAIANRQLEGGLSEQLSEINTVITDIWAQLEAAVDFSDEDIEPTPYEQLADKATTVHSTIQRLIESYETGKALTDGLSAVILGRPNVGKSSLLNWLLKEEKAIVTDIPGTTRDVIEDHMVIKGVSVKIQDTAGIIDTADVVERAGIEKALARGRSADVIFCVLDGSRSINDTFPHELEEIFADKHLLVLLTKSDLPHAFGHEDVSAIQSIKAASKYAFCRISAVNNVGLHDFEDAFSQLSPSAHSSETGQIVLTKARHKILLDEMLVEIDELIKGLRSRQPEELLAENAKECLDRSNEITGETLRPDVLDTIFSKFCIGK